MLSRPIDAECPLVAGKMQGFTVRLAPMRRHGSKETPITDTDQIAQWLGDLLERNGMRLVHVRQIVPQKIPLGRRGENAAREGGPVLRTVLVSMAAEVTDLGKASQAWKRGIGRHKAWGCGTLIACDLRCDA
ncbi:CRISPR associated protein [mine drainage metagenome]|uniref:CRISPR associated protein n=1 Tax=mine drainage metagenome TaxID=410659 RepID=A0A1J5PJT5_9ZZZZ